MKQRVMRERKEGVYALKPEERMNVIWLTRKDLSKALHCSPQTISNMVKDGGFPKPMLCGRKLLWHPKVVDKWILERCA